MDEIGLAWNGYSDMYGDLAGWLTTHIFFTHVLRQTEKEIYL